MKKGACPPPPPPPHTHTHTHRRAHGLAIGSAAVDSGLSAALLPTALACGQFVAPFYLYLP